MISFHYMGQDGSYVRVDVWFEGLFVGDLSLNHKDWERLKQRHAAGELKLELK